MFSLYLAVKKLFFQKDPVVGHVLTCVSNNGKCEWKAESFPATQLQEMNNVDDALESGIENGEVLTWVASNNQWESQPIEFTIQGYATQGEADAAVPAGKAYYLTTDGIVKIML